MLLNNRIIEILCILILLYPYISLLYNFAILYANFDIFYLHDLKADKDCRNFI